MKNVKILFALFVVIVPLSGLSQINSNTSADLNAGHCCNNNFPGYWITYPYQKFNPEAPAGMDCNGVEYDITRRICARYWSAYGSDPTEMCQYLPGDLPLPPIPVPGNFNVTRTYDHHPQLSWNWYYVHWYRIYRKIDDGSWQIAISKLGDPDNYWIDSWVDTDIDLSQGIHTYYCKMQGSVYDAYSNFTEVKSIQAYSATISGPSYLKPNQVGTFTAQPSGGVPPYDYTWYRMELCDESESQWGGVEPLRPPCNEWVHLSQFDGSQMASSSGIYPGFKMRVDVEDHDSYLLSVEKTISVGRGLPKPLAQENSDREASIRFALLPNHPNPFNPETTIEYWLAEESRVSLGVYNLLGEEVKRLVDDNQLVGRYSIRWDSKDRYGKDVSGGIYIYKIEAVSSSGKFAQSRKMILIK